MKSVTPVDLSQLEKAILKDKNISEEKVSNMNDFEGSFALSAEKEFENKRHEIELKSLQNEIDTRKFLTDDLFKIIKYWFAFIAFVIVANGVDVELVRRIPFVVIKSFDLSDKIMLTLLGSTTITIVGLYSPVISHFFHKGKNK